jgi:hypothetical protein
VNSVLNAEHAPHLAVTADQRRLDRFEQDPATVRVGHPLVVTAGLVRGQHGFVHLAEALGDLGGKQIEIGFAREIHGVADELAPCFVAAQIDAVPVLVKNDVGNGVENGAQLLEFRRRGGFSGFRLVGENGCTDRRLANEGQRRRDDVERPGVARTKFGHVAAPVSSLARRWGRESERVQVG